MAGVPGDDRSDAVDCDSCGARLSRSMRYCPSCGTRQARADGADGSSPQQPPRNDANDGRDGRDGSMPRSDRSADRHRSRSESDTHPRRDSGSRHGGSTARTDEETDRQLLERRIATELEKGWTLEHDFGDHAVLVKRSFGSVGMHLLIALITIWSTMGAGNALYAGYKYFTDVDRKVVRPEHVRAESRQPTEQRTASDSDSTHESRSESRSNAGSTAARTDTTTNRLSVPRIFAVGCCWLVALALLLEGSLLVSGFGALLFVTGAAMLPSIRRRIRKREPITTNGRTRSITEERVRAPDRPCGVCHRSFETGIERTYRERFRLLGISLVTTERGTNYYCPDCAGLEATARNRTDDTDETGERPDTDATAERRDTDSKSNARSESEPRYEPTVPSVDTDTESESDR